MASQNPSRAPERYLKGLLHAARGELEPATTELRTAVHLAPENAAFRLALALILVVQDRREEARAQLEWIISLSPDTPEAAKAREHLVRLD